MHARASPNASSADVAVEVSSLSVGLGILTMALFPFALPALVLLAPLALVPVAGTLLAAPILLPLWLAGNVRRGSSGGPLVAAGNTPPMRRASRRLARSGNTLALAPQRSHSITSAGLGWRDRCKRPSMDTRLTYEAVAAKRTDRGRRGVEPSCGARSGGSAHTRRGRSARSR